MKWSTKMANNAIGVEHYIFPWNVEQHQKHINGKTPNHFLHKYTIKNRATLLRDIGRQSVLILLFFCVVILGIASSAFAELSCGDPGSCVITFNWYYERNISMYVVLQTMEGVDETCTPLNSLTTGINPPFTPVHENVYIKYYWSGTAWVGIKIASGGSYVLGQNTTPGTNIRKVTKSFNTSPDWDIINNPLILFPKGCSDLITLEQNFGGVCSTE